MAYQEDVNVNLNVLAGTMGGITAIMGGMSALTSSFGAMSTAASDSFGTVDGLLITTTALLGTFATQAASAFGEFEQGMKIVQTVSGQTSYAIQQLGDEANKLSVKYRTAINDITDGLQTLGRAGLNSANTQLEVLESGLQTAKLEGRNLNGVLEELIQNTAMLGGDLKSVDFGNQTEYLNSLLVGTSMTAPITSHDISQTLQYAGGTAAAAGANLDDKAKLEDLMGTVAAFAQKGVTGSMAGTALRAFFTKPASQDKSVTDALGSIGLSASDLWEDGGNSMKKVSDQIAIIKGRMDALNLSTMDQVEIWGKIVGAKMGQQMMKLNSDSIRELTTDIQGAQSAQELANQTLDTYNQKLNQLKQEGDLVFRELGEQFATFLTPVLDGLNLITDALSNPMINRGVFYGIMAIIGNGIRAAWNMIRTVGSQLMGLIRNTEQAMANLASGTTPLANGLSVSASRAELLNTKLAETNAELQAIQGNLLGINKPTWFAAGANPNEKVDKGVIASANQNVIIGGTTTSGIQFGEAGKVYTMEEANRMKEDMVAKSKLRSEIEENITAKESRLTEIDTALTQRQALLDEVNSFAGLSGAKRIRSIGGAQSWIDDQIAMRQNALENIPNPRENIIAQMNAAGVSEDDVLRYINQKDANNETSIDGRRQALEKKLASKRQSYMMLQEMAVAETVGKGERVTDSLGRPIGNPSAYIHKTYENSGKIFDEYVDDYFRSKDKKKGHTLYAKTTPEFENHSQEYLELTKEVQAILRELKALEKEEAGVNAVNPDAAEWAPKYQTAVNPNNPQAKLYDKIKSQTMELEELDAQIKEADSEDIQRTKKSLQDERRQILAELEQAKEQVKTLPDSGLKLKSLNAQISELEGELNARMIMMEESMFKREMEYLRIRAQTGDEVAKFAYRHNQELMQLDKLDLGNGYMQMYSPKDANLTAYERNEKFMSKFATHSQAGASMQSVSVKEIKSNALSAIRNQGVVGASRQMYDKLVGRGESYNNNMIGLTHRASSALSQFGTSLKTAIMGVESMRPAINEAIVGLEVALPPVEEFSTLLSVVGGELGITEEQLARLIAEENEESAIITRTIAERLQEQEFLALKNALDEQGITLLELDNVKREELIAIIEAEIRARGMEVAGTGAAGKSGGKLGNALSALTGYMGGPFFVGMMAVTEGMRLIQESQSKWQERMNEAVNQLSEASDKLSKAKENIANALRNENSSISEAQIDQFTDYQIGALQSAYQKSASASFGDMYTNEVNIVGKPELSDAQKEQQEADKEAGKEKPYTPDEDAMISLEESATALSLAEDENIQALKENTAELNAAVYAYSQAEALKQKEFTDGIWGWTGFGTQVSDSIGRDLGSGNRDIYNLLKEVRNQFGGEGFFDSNSPVLTASQKDKNYAGSTEFAGVMAADLYQANLIHYNNETEQQVMERALEGFFGNDYDRIIGLMRNMDGKLEGNAMGAINSANLAFANMDADTAAQAQLMFKDNKEDLQKLGKQMFRYEQQYGFDPSRTAASDITGLMGGVKQVSKGKKTLNELTKKDLKSITKDLSKAKLTVTDKNLVNTVKMFMQMSGGKMDEGNIIAMGSLQQLQDMYQIANEQVAPGINQTVQGVNNTVAQTQIAGANAGSAADGAGSAANNAAAIAAFLGAQAQETAEHSEFLKLQREGYSFDSEEDFRAQLAQGKLPRAEREILKTLEGTSWSLMNGDNDPDHIKQNAERLYGKLGESGTYQDKLNTATWGIIQYAEGAVRAGYSASNIGEYGSGDTGSGGGSGGSGDGSGSDKDNGTRKERVDLVLCNKKEIPKLNVNLFKKAPNFTILNKNFKLRDIKINSEDKPKAIMSAIKNGIIETQKRMDPKIIQDDQAEYDPLAATEGSSTPSGTTKTTSS